MSRRSRRVWSAISVLASCHPTRIVGDLDGTGLRLERVLDGEVHQWCIGAEVGEPGLTHAGRDGVLLCGSGCRVRRVPWTTLMFSSKVPSFLARVKCSREYISTARAPVMSPRSRIDPVAQQDPAGEDWMVELMECAAGMRVLIRQDQVPEALHQLRTWREEDLRSLAIPG